MADNIDKLAIASLVCGLVSIFVFPLAFGGTAIVLGLYVMNHVEDKEGRDYGNARIGIIAGIVGIVLWVATLATMGYLGIDAGSLLGSSSGSASAF